MFFTHIKHGFDHNNHLYIEEIRGVIPSADEMLLDKYLINAFENPQEFTLKVFFASNFSEKLQVNFHSSAIGKSIVLQTRFYNYEPNVLRAK